MPKPRVKHRIDLNDFSARHQSMICMLQRPHPHGHGAHPNYVTLFEFRLFRALVNIRLTALQNSNNQIQQQIQKLIKIYKI